MRVVEDLGDPVDAARALLHQCWLAYLSDDLAFDSARRLHPSRELPEFEEEQMGASLDHTIWFHRPLRADRWHLHDVSCLGYFGHRGLAVGRVFTDTFAGIAPASAPPFVLAQLAGLLVGIVVVLALYPDVVDHADDVVIPHHSDAAAAPASTTGRSR